MSGKRANSEGKSQLIAWDEARDLAICGCSLACRASTRFAANGAHDPTPTYYFVLEDLFSRFDFSEGSHLLDVGCGTGRALAYFAERGFPGKATGVELDPSLTHVAQEWTAQYPNINVSCGNVLNTSLAPYTHFYLFNPFDTRILVQFIAKVERETTGRVQLCHMSDNGETFNYMFHPDFSLRDGWTLMEEGTFQMHEGVAAYDAPQHFSFWQYEK